MANLSYLTNFLPYEWHHQKKLADDRHASRSFLDRLLGRGANFYNHPALSSDKAKGAGGELMVAAWLNIIANDKDVLLNSVLIPNNNSISGDTELDIIWLGSHGIVVVEVKAYSGYVITNNARDWDAGNGDGKWKIKSPVDQAMRQARELKNYLKKNGVKVPVKAIVAMPKIKKIEFRDKTRVPVIQSLDGLTSFLNESLENTIGSDRVNEALGVLSSLKRA